MVAEFGRDDVEAYMGHVQDNAEEAVRRVLATFGGGEFALEMDDGAIIRVRISVNAEARSRGSTSPGPAISGRPISTRRAPSPGRR
jgi:5-oxoprolinase (ATP-hydrolysing)